MSLLPFPEPAPRTAPPQDVPEVHAVVSEGVLRAARVQRDATGSGTTLPRAPQTPDETGLGLSFLVELTAKVMYELGLSRLTELSQHLCLSGAVVEAVCQFMRREGFVEVSRRGTTEADVQYDLTGQGRARAAEWLQRSRYVGAAPVTLEAYTERVAQQSVQRRRLDAWQVAEAFADLVVTASLRDRLGVAVNSGRPILLHGLPGSGKTYLARHLSRIVPGTVAIPHAVMVHGAVIRVFDALHHQPVAASGVASVLDNRGRADPRWVVCERPVVACGGELTLDMLDLRYDERAGTYEAPPQFKANNGVFIVDDLGRQLVSPRELLNRWIVPMERRHDHLVLRTGGTFTIPFDPVLVFSTNLAPADLDDAAFLRRLGHKIHIEPLPGEDYRRVVEAACAAAGVAFDEAGCARLIGLHAAQRQPMLACIPGDLVHLAASRAAYRGEPARFNTAALDWAWAAYFGRD